MANINEEVPEQLVPAFAPKPLSKTSEKLYNYGRPKEAAARAYDLISISADAVAVPEVQGPPPVKKAAFNFTRPNPDGKKAYLARARALGLTVHTQNEFFGELGLVHKIALTTKLLIRLGFDHSNEVFKIYVKKDNFSAKASIIQILLSEVDDFSEYVKGQLFPMIDDGLRSGDFVFKTPPGEMPLKPSFAEFWEDNNGGIYMADSGRLRLRTTHLVGRCYQFYLNNPVTGSMYPGYFGPKIVLSRQELEALIKILGEIKGECPPLDEI